MTNLQRGFAPIVIVLLLIAGAAVAGGGYYAVTKHQTSVKAKVAQSQQQTTSMPTVTVTATATPSKTATPTSTAKPSAKPTASPLPAIYGDDLKVFPYSSGWSIKVRSTVAITGNIDSYPGMAVIRVIPTVRDGSTYTLTISGFPVNTDLHIYTNGYREHEVRQSNAAGTLIFTRTTPIEYIIKDTPS